MDRSTQKEIISNFKCQFLRSEQEFLSLKVILNFHQFKMLKDITISKCKVQIAADSLRNHVFTDKEKCIQ